ncbi:RNA ligase [Methanobacterium sp. ACI-7]|uniref:RNA ligase n=1 Tax=unclassified Methanobacterium TaxID=2627676 RepID=UPI0039C16851
MNIDWRRNNSLTNFFLNCSSCDLESRVVIEDFLDKKLQKILGIKAEKINHAIEKGIIKFFDFKGIPTLQFRKDVGKIEAGTLIYFDNDIEIIRGFPKTRRTLMLSPTLKNHFKDKIVVEEKMNGYNVRIASIGDKIVALTRGGYMCPYTTKKAIEIMDLEEFFNDNKDLVICGEMVGTENPYVSHYYKEIGSLGFRVFDIRKKVTNDPLTIDEKYKLLEEYGLPSVRVLGTFNIDEASAKVKEIIKEIGEENREGVVIKDPDMELIPLKYTSSEAHDDEIKYAFTYPFDFGKDFFFSRVVREGFQAYEMEENEGELEQRAKRLGEAILYSMLDTIKKVSSGEIASEDMVIDVESKDEAEEFLRHLHDLGVYALLDEFMDNKATVKRIHQSTTDKINNFLNGGLY